MNLHKSGAHASADWLLTKVRALRGSVAVHLDCYGGLVVRESRRDHGGPSLVGTYTKGIGYADLVADLAHIRADYERGAYVEV